MSRAVFRESLQGKVRQEVVEQVQQQAKHAALAAIRPLITAFLEAEVDIQLGRKKGESRRVSQQARNIEWKCHGCGCQDAHQFTRDGHYKRNLETGWGHVQEVQIPMLECQNCQHDVICTFSILEKYQRYWLDLDQDVLFSSGIGQSMRQISQRWSQQKEGPVGLRTINERINQIEPLIERMRQSPVQSVPPIVQIDGIWVTVQKSTGVNRVDTRKRTRKKRSGKKSVILVALGFWEDGSRQVLDWHLAPSEERAQWTILLQRLHARGVRHETGLKMIVRDGCGGVDDAITQVYGQEVLDQRCIFHKLKNVADCLRSELKGGEQAYMRKILMKQASAIYQAPTVSQAYQRLKALGEQWRSLVPKTVATMERDFAHTVVYYQLEELPRAWIRTTSLLERTNRELRRKFRQVVTFGSQVGTEVAVYLQVQRLHARWNDSSWWQVAHRLIFALEISNP